MMMRETADASRATAAETIQAANRRSLFWPQCLGDDVATFRCYPNQNAQQDPLNLKTDN